jgi:hypothetical protein
VARTQQDHRFDQILHKGDSVKLTNGVLATVRSVLSSDTAAGMVELLTPLFGGTKATVNAGRVVHATA